MHLLVLQHARIEHPGILQKFLEEDGHSWEVVHLDEGQEIPSIDKFDGLWVLGGPMDVWQEQDYPWLKKEKAFIKMAVEEKGIPFLGLCLGHQLLAESLGGVVGKSETAEVGVMEVQLTEEGASGILFDGIPEKISCLQWHGAEIKKLPVGAKVLATSKDCAVQAMSWGPRAYSMQFHVEIEHSTIADWATISEYADSLKAALGPSGQEKLEKDCAVHMNDFNTMAERLYLNWRQTSAHV